MLQDSLLAEVSHDEANWKRETSASREAARPLLNMLSGVGPRAIQIIDEESFKINEIEKT